MGMHHLKLAGTVALLALSAWSPGSARADALLTGFQKGNSPGRFVDFLNPVTFDELGKAINLTPNHAVGLAVGNGNVYVSYNNGTSGQIARYDLNGNLLTSIGVGNTNTIGPLAYLIDSSVQVPEPAPLAGLATGLLGLTLVRRQRVA